MPKNGQKVMILGSMCFVRLQTMTSNHNQNFDEFCFLTPLRTLCIGKAEIDKAEHWQNRSSAKWIIGVAEHRQS